MVTNINEAFRFWSYAEAFLDASDAVAGTLAGKAEAERLRLYLPAYYLVGHSIELALKSFLLAQGHTEECVKKKYGHDLEKVLCAARRRQLGRQVKLTDKERTAIRLLSRTYGKKRFEYMVYGQYSLPEYTFIRGIAQRLVQCVEYYASNSPYNRRRQLRKRP